MQTAYNFAPEAGRPGTFDDSGPSNRISFAPDVATAPGRLMIRRDQTIDSIPVGGPPAAEAAAVDSIIASGVSSASPQVLTEASFDGTPIGSNFLGVPDFVQFVFDSNTDWDASNITVTGILADGSTGTDTIAIPEDGNATVVGTVAFWRVTQVDIPAQTGPGGTYTMGNSATGRTLTAAQILGVLHEDPSVADGPALVAPADLANGRRENQAAVNFSGGFWVETEEALTPSSAAIFVRCVATAPEQLGTFRTDADGGDAVQLTGFRVNRAPAAGLASLQINLS